MFLTRTGNGIAAVCEIFAALITASIFVVMLAQILSRYAFNQSILWSEEICMMGLTWMVFLGSVALTRDWAHVRVPLVVESLGRRIQRPLEVTAQLISLGFLICFAWFAYDTVSQSFHRTSPMLGISTRWIKLAIPVGATLMAVLTLVVIAETLRAVERSANDTSEQPDR